MKITDISRTDIGTQIVLELRESNNETQAVTVDHPQWLRWSNVAKQIQRERCIEGTFERADLRQYIGGLLVVQLSWRKDATEN